MEGHWRAFLEGIGGALVGIGGHWRALAGIGGPPRHTLPRIGRKAQDAVYPTNAGVLESRDILQQRHSHVDYPWQNDQKSGLI